MGSICTTFQGPRAHTLMTLMPTETPNTGSGHSAMTIRTALVRFGQWRRATNVRHHSATVSLLHIRHSKDLGLRISRKLLLSESFMTVFPEISEYFQDLLASDFSFPSFFCFFFFFLMPEIFWKRKTVPMVLDQKKNINEFAGF